jgi:hypothetical protein
MPAERPDHRLWDATHETAWFVTPEVLCYTWADLAKVMRNGVCS